MKKNTLLIVGIALVLIIIAALYASRAQEEDTITIGFIGILSGEYVSVGENILRGAQLAYEEYKREHPDVSVEFIVEDDGFDAKRGLSAYQKLVSIDKVDALINTSSVTIDAIYDLASEEDFPVSLIWNQSITPVDDNVFQISPGYVEAERKLGRYVFDEGFGNIALVYVQNDTILEFKKGFVEGYSGRAQEFILSSDDRDVRTQVLKVVQSGPEAIVLLMFPELGAQFVKELFVLSDNQPPLFFDANFQSGFEDYKRILGDLSILDGARVGALVQDLQASFVEAYRERYGVEPPFAADFGYDSFSVLMQSYDRNGKRWINNLKKQGTFDSVSGTLVFDEAGVRLPTFEVQVIENGALVDIK